MGVGWCVRLEILMLTAAGKPFYIQKLISAIAQSDLTVNGVFRGNSNAIAVTLCLTGVETVEQYGSKSP